MREIDPPAIVRSTEDFVFVGREVRAGHQAIKARRQEKKHHIQKAKEHIQKAREKTLEDRKQALSIGKRLLEVQPDLKRAKQWNSWLRDVAWISARTATRYIEWAKWCISDVSGFTSDMEQLLSEEANKEWRRIWGNSPKPSEQISEELVEEVSTPQEQPKDVTEGPKEPEYEEEEYKGGDEENESEELEDYQSKDDQVLALDPQASTPAGSTSSGVSLLIAEDISSSPEPTTNNRGKAGKKGDFVLLDEWKNLSIDKQKEILGTKGTTKFNKQEEEDSTRQGNIEWALWSWNPVTGCKHDCPYCYARDIANRLFEPKFEPTLWPNRLSAPRNTLFPADKAAEWMGHKNVFVCSMADLFGRWVPREWIDAVLRECAICSEWNFLFLTKFPNRMSEFEFSDNCWVGTTVDCQARVKNAEKSFRKVKAKFKWLSCEPMIEPLRFTDIGAFQWIVIGGASRSTQTPEWHPPREWVVNLEAEAWKNNCAVYEKTNLYPCDVGEARIRQYPGIEREVIKPPDSMIYLPQEIG